MASKAALPRRGAVRETGGARLEISTMTRSAFALPGCQQGKEVCKCSRARKKFDQDLSDKFTRAKGVIVAEFNKLDVDTVNQLRRKLRDGKVEWKVLKNTLAKRAAKGTAVEKISDDFVGPVAAAISYDDVVAPAKILSEFVKNLDTVKIRSGVVQGQKIDKAGVMALAKLPGLNELRATILSMLNQPATKLLRTIKEPSGALVRVIKAKSEKV